MRLKRVKIFGFKTFADRTEFDVDGDLIAVVGPNGCGKSNIVDAILWGLGEPNARHLRAASNQEVIFSGSSKRKPLGFAEVSLVFDNDDRALAIDSPEVVITRRVHRNGDSEYEINRQRCRLKDIYDVLADSGLGRSGYAIVGQKEIDAALAASAEDRRGWIDEAAGVQRYRAKRNESLRKLGQANEHLSRVDDIVREISSQREPLRSEAETALRYRAAVDELKGLEIGLLAHDLVKARQEIDQAEAQRAETVAAAEKELLIGQELAERGQKIGEEIAELERQLDAHRELQQHAISAKDRAEAAIALAQERLASLDALEKNLSEDGEAGGDRILALQNDVNQAGQEAAKETARLAEIRANSEQAGCTQQQILVELANVESKLAGAKEAEAKWQQFQAEAGVRKARRKAVEIELQTLEKTLPGLEEGLTGAQLDHDRAAEEVQKLRAQLAQLQDARRKLAKDSDNLALRMRQILSQVAALEGKRNGIEATLETHEGLSQGSRAVLAGVAEGVLPKEYKPVAEALQADPEHALAIETALGGAAHDLIVPHESHAKKAIAWLKEKRLGRATFQPIPLMRPNQARPELRELLRQRGVVGIASELVQFEAAFRPVIESILGRVLITETLDDALALAKTSGWSRIVTLDGEVVHSAGAVTGGASSRQTSGILQRRAELESTLQQIEVLKKQLVALEKGEAQSAGAELESKEAALVSQIRELEEEYQNAQRWLGSVKFELQQTRKDREKLNAELETLSSTLEAVVAPEATDVLEADRDRLMVQAATIRTQSELAAHELVEAEARCAAAKRREEDARRRADLESSSAEQRAKKLAGFAEERQKAALAITESQQRREEAASQYEAGAAKLVELGETKKRRLEESFALAEEAKRAEMSAQLLRNRSHQSELERAKADARRAAALERLLDEYGLDEGDAIRISQEQELPENSAGQVATLRREIKGMGEVNLGAIEAFARLTERYDELTVQRDDVVAGIHEIESSIAELDKLTNEKFAVAFQRVKDAFTTTFAELFGGGEGVLSLTNPNDLLDSGVDVEVTIPGKRRQRLELLSGGERALSAVAFLFALLKVKPSPLVVLDEVDAPLDGRNVERFINGLRGFAGMTQFICITHNPLTIESAPIWFGVTMQEPGVTTVVPYVAERRTLSPAPELSLTR